MPMARETKGIVLKTLVLIATVAALSVAIPASAQFGNRLRQMVAPPAQNAAGFRYAFYEGELHFEHGVDSVCTALTNGTYKVYFAARSSQRGVEAYMYGEQIMHAYISGSDRNHLSVTFLGESAPSHSMRLLALGTGFLGLVQSKTLVSELYGACTASNSEFKVSLTNRDAQTAFQDYAEQFQLDLSSEQDLILAQRGNIKEALPRLQQAFAQKAKKYSPNHPQMLRYYFYLARAYEESGQYPFSAYWYQKAAAVCAQSFGPENACAPATQLKLGQSLAANGNPRDAETNIRHALLVADKVFGREAPVSWLGLNPLASVLIGTGRYAEAESTLKQALALAKRDHGGDLNAAVVKVTYAALYRQTGQFKLAEDTLREAIAIDQKAHGPDSTASIGPKVMLAQMMRLSGQSAAAEPIARNALDAAVKVLGPERPDHPALSGARVGMAYIDMELGKSRDAEDLIRQALDNDKKYLGPNHPSVAVDEMALAKLLRTTGREPDALPLLQDAYRISHLTDLQGIRWRVPGELMELYASGKLANPVLAIFYGKEAINGLQSVRGNLSHSSSGTLQSFISAKEVKTIYTTLAQLLLADSRISEAQQVLALVSEQEMDRFIQSSLLADAPSAASGPGPETKPRPETPSGSGSTSNGGTPRNSLATAQPRAEVTLSKSERELADLNAKQVEYGQEYDRLKKLQQEQGDDFSASDQAKLNDLQAKMEDYQSKFQAAQARIAKSSKDPVARQLRSQEISGFTTEFQGTLKNVGHDAVVAEYFITDNDVEIILTTPSAVITTTSPIKAAKLNQLIRDFRKNLSDPNQNPLPQSQQLYTALIAPISAALDKANAKTLMLLLHDTLRYVPFAALNNGKSYLIENMAVVNVNDAARDKLGTQPKPAPWSVWGLGVTKAGPDYPALPNVRKELNDIMVTLGGKSQIKLDQDFTEAKLQAGLGGTGYYPVIHIASHFQFTPGSIDNSVLLLGDGSRLSLKQIETKLNFTGVELLTLSACETAVGDDTLASDGGEVEGLGAVAQRKGAMAVIATLWPVADESTATLMNTLYKGHIDHLDKAESLRQAQLALLHGSVEAAVPATGDEHRGLTRVNAAPAGGGATRDSRSPYAHPFFWAPFILMGNWL
jgi:CHAT domain-containing protein